MLLCCAGLELVGPLGTSHYLYRTRPYERTTELLGNLPQLEPVAR